MNVYLLHQLSYFYPETALVVAFLAALLAAAIFRKTALPSAIVSMLGIVVAYALVLQKIDANELLFRTMYAVDPFGIFFKLLFLGVGLIVILFSLGSKELETARERLGEYYSLIPAMLLGMVLMAGSTNLIFMYLSLELTSISSYILAGFTKKADDSAEAALKYVIYGALSSGLMLYGISILYGLTGVIDIYNINMVIAQGNIATTPLVIAIVLILAGFGYKISAVPFHFWTPDVYEGAPTAITAFLSVASKAAGFAMMIRFFKICFIDARALVPGSEFWTLMKGFDWTQIIAILSVLTMTLGNLVAIWQKNLKRLLAYSSIAHAGYIMMGVVVLSNQGLAAVLLYFLVYLFMNLGAFYVVMIVAEKTGSEDIDDYKGLGARAPFVGVAMAIFLVSLTGLPPTAGFIGKLYLFGALISAKWIWLAIVGAINSVVSLYYYARVFRNLFLRESQGSKEPLSFGWHQIAIVLLLVVPVIGFGLYFTPLVEAATLGVRMFGLR